MSGAPGPHALIGGRIVPFGEARISPLDRGFLFGDAVYEAIKVSAGRPLFLGRHLERLAASLAAMRIASPGELGPMLRELVAVNELAAGAIYLQVTRGVAASRTHLPPTGLAPTIFAMTTAIEFSPRPEAAPGLAAIARRDDRWGRCDIKTTALAAGVLGKLAAADAGAVEVLYADPSGALREGGNTNLFVRDAAGWHTHPLGPEILAGVTRAVILEAAAALGLPIAARAPQLARRGEWTEAFLSGTTTGVRGLVSLDGEPIGDGQVGAETRRFARGLAELERSA